VKRQHNRFSPEWWEAWTELDRATGCRNWRGSTCREGRGRIWYKGKGGVLVYRVAYECFYGPFDDALKVCHTCDNPRCVNPYHLFLGTQKDNLRDMFRKGRARPRGRAARLRQAPLATPRLASENPHAGVASIDILHLTRTLEPIGHGAQVAPVWCRVTGVPPIRPTRAVVLYKRPIEWTLGRAIDP